MIDLHAALEIVSRYRGDAVVIPAMTSGRHWPTITDKPDLDLALTGAMGKGSSMALGIALARPERKVIVFDGDGSLVMNLGTLVSMANKAPKNLVYFVMANGAYCITGGQPVPGHDFASFTGMARECGFKAAYEFDNLEEFATTAPEIFSGNGPVFVCLKTVPEIETRPIGQRPAFARTPEAYPRVWKALRQ
ncbi:MAG: thiamine pyrophosphate-binding protein [Chloroflexi bacterium]|nr:thiamine pyrophosphate-binding protein [Chloroflexota bacterium]